jgi:parallel beta helix pectate lyase-like protein
MSMPADGSGFLLRLARVLALIAVVTMAPATFAAKRTFVRSTGLDSNPCSLTAPCRSFAVAIASTDPAGEIVVLDSAGYGAVTITQSVSILAPRGVYAGVSVFSGAGVRINGAGIDVTLRGLSINGLGGQNGIDFALGARLTIDGCAISNMNAAGILLQAGGSTMVANASVRKSGGAGIELGATDSVSVVDSEIARNAADGLWLHGGARASVQRSVIAGNALSGIKVDAAASGTRLAVRASIVADHTAGAGISIGGTGGGVSANADISGNTITRNVDGIAVTSAAGAALKVNAADNQISNHTGAGILSSQAGSDVRTGGNGIFRNTKGFGPQGAGVLYTPASNYVRDNTADDGGHTPDSLL